jgi:octaprenyl-diphosphate synthase
MEDALARYGMHVGTAFQLIDDVLDYSGDLAEIGKNLGDDLAEGKPTLPLIRALQVGSKADVALIRGALNGTGAKDFEAILAALKRSDALAYAQRLAEADAAAAASCLDAIPDSGARRTLLELTTFAVTRRS